MNAEEQEQRQKQEQWLADQQAPASDRNAFICPVCGAYAHQEWFGLYAQGEGATGFVTIRSRTSRCAHCGHYAYWVGDKLVYPLKRQGPPPHPEMPDEPRADYNEARDIVGLSPRGACALLRLALQKLAEDLGGDGKNLNTDIATLVQKGCVLKCSRRSTVCALSGTTWSIPASSTSLTISRRRLRYSTASTSPWNNSLRSHAA